MRTPDFTTHDVIYSLVEHKDKDGRLRETIYKGFDTLTKTPFVIHERWNDDGISFSRENGIEGHDLNIRILLESGEDATLEELLNG